MIFFFCHMFIVYYRTNSHTIIICLLWDRVMVLYVHCKQLFCAIENYMYLNLLRSLTISLDMKSYRILLISEINEMKISEVR